MERKLTAGVIGASSESIYAISEAKARGITTVAVDGNPDAPGLKHADISEAVDLNDRDALVAFFDRHPVDFLLPVPVGRILVASGYINEKYGLPGISYEAARLATDKWEFHTTLAARGLRKAEAVLIEKGESSDKIKGMDFPIVLKPRFGSGSREVKVYGSFDGLKKDIADVVSDEEDFIAETYVSGTEYGADAVVFNGEFQLILLREKILTPEPYRQCVGYFALSRDEASRRLFEESEKLLRGTVAALGFDNCLMHADIIFDGEEAFLIEISPRPSGHNLHNCFTIKATGFDMLNNYMDFAAGAACGKSYIPSCTYSAEGMMIRYFDLREGVIRDMPSQEEAEVVPGMIEYRCGLRKGDRISLVTDGRSVMGRGYYIVKADTLEKAMDICRKVEDLFEIEEK